MRISKRQSLIIVILIACGPGTSQSIAQPQAKEFEATAKKHKRSSYKPVSNFDVLGRKNARLLYAQSERSLKTDDIVKALKTSKRAVELDPDDMDARVAYGEALYKMHLYDKSDSSIFNECVKTWLIVHRELIGEEKGLNYKGIGIPLVMQYYEDGSRSVTAKKRLKSLCGRVPKFWETNKKYLTAVLKPSTSVSGALLLPPDTETDTIETSASKPTSYTQFIYLHQNN